MSTLRASHRIKQLTEVALYGALYGVVFWFCYRRIDPDFGWHLQSGRYIVAHGGVPGHDIFTYTARNFPWINHEWLSDVIISQLYRVGGMVAVAAVFAAVWAAAVGLAARWRWPVAALGVIGLMNFIVVRPLAFTALFLGVEWLIWSRWPARRWLLVPLFLVWANLHGGFSLGLAILAFLMVWQRQWRWWWLLPAVVVATFVNPYGPRLYVEIWRTLSDPALNRQVTEWAPLQLTLWAGAYIVAALFGLLWLGTWRQPLGLMSCGLLITAIISARQYMPFVIVSLPALEEAYARGVGYLRSIRQLRRWLVPAITATVFVLLAATFVRQLPVTNEYPVAAVAALRQQPCSGQIFNNFDFGGYLIWKLPGVPVYIDGRMPSWKVPGTSRPNNTYMDRYLTVAAGGKVVNQEFARYNIRCAILYDGQEPLSKQLLREGWKATARDSTATLWRKPAQKVEKSYEHTTAARPRPTK